MIKKRNIIKEIKQGNLETELSKKIRLVNRMLDFLEEPFVTGEETKNADN